MLPQERGRIVGEKVKHGDMTMTRQLNDSTDLDRPNYPSKARGLCHGKPCIRGLRYPVETASLSY